MAGQEQAQEEDSPRKGNESEENQDKLTDGAKKSDNQKPPKHIIRILGSYSLLTFFTSKAQAEFFDITTYPEFEEIFSFDTEYAKGTDSFEFDKKEKDFELKMTNHGFVREAFWKEAFPPIFKFKNMNCLIVPDCEWLVEKIESTWDAKILVDASMANFKEAFLYRYSLKKLPGELEKIMRGENKEEKNGELKIHIGLNKFGIVNIGITIKSEQQENEQFEDLCRRAFKKVAHLQEDPLRNLENEWEASQESFLENYLPSEVSSRDALIKEIKKMVRSENEEISEWESNAHIPRLLVTYFQVLAITMIHLHLFEKLEKFDQDYPNLKSQGKFNNGKLGGKIKKFKKHGTSFTEILAKPWLLSNQIQGSPRKGLPPLRHVVFMYQLVYSFGQKQSFLSFTDHKRALLTLGHNVGWDPSPSPPFPVFVKNSEQDLLKDSSLLENSCCLIFPQGLVIVIPPDQYVCLGGDRENNSSTVLPYLDYWKLIFKLFIRVVEARLLIGMVNKYLSDAHKYFIKYRNSGFFKRIKSRKMIYHQLTHIGWVMQRISEKIVGPEVTRFSFVRKKIASFMEGVNFEEHMRYVQSELQQLNGWLNQDIIKSATLWAVFVGSVGAILGAYEIAKDFWKPLSDPVSITTQENIETLPKRLDSMRDNIEKQERAIGAVKSEVKKLEGNIMDLKKALKALKLSVPTKETSPQGARLPRKENGSEESPDKDPSKSAPLQK